MKLKRIAQTTALGTLLMSGQLMAADGDLSTTDSSATAEVRATIPQMVRVTGFGGGDDAFELGTYDPAAPGAMVATEDFCVYRNKDSGTYQLKLEGDGGLVAGDEFRIATATDELDYTVQFGADENVLSAYNTPGTVLTNLAANTVDAACSSGVKAGVEITVSDADALAARAGSYTGDLIVTVTVE